jgi:hypothetical protein
MNPASAKKTLQSTFFIRLFPKKPADGVRVPAHLFLDTLWREDEKAAGAGFSGAAPICTDGKYRRPLPVPKIR